MALRPYDDDETKERKLDLYYLFVSGYMYKDIHNYNTLAGK